MDKENLLDTPVQPVAKAPRSGFEIQNRVDFGINLFLLCITWLSVATAFLGADTGFFFAMLAMIPLGGYQMLSAMVGALRKNQAKGIYFLVALIHLGFIFLYLQNTNDPLGHSSGNFPIGILLIGILPLIGATYYTFLCYQSVRRYGKSSSSEN